MGANKRKILTIGDAISASTGLGRIHRDIVTRALESLSDVCEIATMGYGGSGTTKIKVPQLPMEGMEEWILPTLPQVCEDFFGNERGIILYIWDLSRTTWFSQPKTLGEEILKKFPGLQEWLLKANIERWIYCPLDGAGPNNRLTFPLTLAAYGFDRILAYGPFCENILRNTLGEEESKKRHLTNLPHAVDTNIFWELPRKNCRKLFFKKTGAMAFNSLDVPAPLQDDEVLIGIIATNQPRKNWELGIHAAAELAKKHKIRLWLHCDKPEKHWSIPALVVDYGLLNVTTCSVGLLTDQTMAEAYSALDLSFGIGPEGWGLPLAESLACGTPVITGCYAGAADFVPTDMQVQTMKDVLGYPAFYFEGIYATQRPVYHPLDWAKKAEEWIGKRTSLDPKYHWDNNWKGWESWFREALK